jgi:hypothetical protein
VFPYYILYNISIYYVFLYVEEKSANPQRSEVTADSGSPSLAKALKVRELVKSFELDIGFR